MAYNNRDLPRIVNPFDVRASSSKPSPRVYIPPSLSNTRLAPTMSLDYQATERQTHHYFGSSYYQCPPSNHPPRAYNSYSGIPKSSHHDSDSALYYCELCKVSCVGRQSFDSHLAGQKHLKREQWKRPTSEEANNPKEVTCFVCNVKCSSTETYNSHLKGKQHAKTVKLQKSRGCEVPDVQPHSSNQPTRPSSPIIPENCIKVLNSGKGTHYSCRLCNCVCNSVKLKEIHVKGKKHQQALRKLKALLASDAKPDTFTTPPSSSAPTSLSAHSKCKPEPPSPGADVPPEKILTLCAITSPCQVPSMPSTSRSTSASSSSSRTSRSHLPPSGFARPPPPQITTSPSMQALTSLPPHLLADERYMQTKLRRIAPSKEENALLTLAVDSVSSALHQIYIARGESDETPISSEDIGQFSGVFVVGPAAIGLLIGGQRTADIVLVLREPPSSDCIAEVKEELEELLKRTCKNHRVTVKAEEGAQLIVEMSPIPASSQSSNSTDPGPSQKDISAPKNLVATVRIRLAAPTALDSEAQVGGSEEQEMQIAKTIHSDPLTEVRRIWWLQEALSTHPDKSSLLNVARLVRCLVRDSLPVPWGEFSDYVLLVLLERLSFMALSPPGAYRNTLSRIRPGLLFRRFLECLAAGVLIGRDGELATLPDPLGSGLLLLDQMKQADRVAVTLAAQETLRLVAFRQIHKLLDLPKFVPPKNEVKLPAAEPAIITTTGKRTVSSVSNGSGSGENGGFGGEVSLPSSENGGENHFRPWKVTRLEQGQSQNGIEIEEELAVRNSLATD